jgi:hypothetical protein
MNKINSLPTIGQTRQAVHHKLGGAFDYSQFVEELRLIVSDKDMIEREFKT